MTLDQLVEAGIVSALDAAFSRMLARLCGEDEPLVQLSAAMASQHARQGHVCLELASWLSSPPESYAELSNGATLSWPTLADVQAALARSSQVERRRPGAPASGQTPLIWDGELRLYLQRYFDHEVQLAHQLTARAAELPPTPEQTPDLDLLFPKGERDEQRAAAQGSLTRQVAIITGGPGTGKTSTVVRLLALYVQSRDQHLPPPRIHLLAPTGKAAARLSESINQAVDDLPVPEAVRAAIPRNAQTLHRVLGLSPGRYRPRYNRDQPLDADLVMVDEASMVDLSSMRRLLDALPAPARLVLLGDPHQLASVEAGAALGDLCRASTQPRSPLSGAVFSLTRSHRYPPDSGIAALSEACRAGEVSQALAILDGPPREDLVLCELDAQQRLPPMLARQVRAHLGGLLKHDLHKQLAALSRFRILCAHRRGALGVEQLNLEAHRALHGVDLSSASDYHGRPIMITENDPGQQLFNGDVAVLHRSRQGRRLTAHLPIDPNTSRELSLAHLPAHESVYAMSVHKSQGSEFDHVAVVLPARSSPVLSRELLYTALTRARRSVHIYANRDILRSTIATRVRRASGLVAALASPVASPTADDPSVQDS